MNICKNCGNSFEGKFCNNCGQKSDTHRFTFKHALHEFVHTFTHVDSGLLYLIKEMFIRPGVVVREYIEGKRKKYFSPMQFLVLGVAVSFFLTLKLGVLGYKNVPPEIFAKLSFWQSFFLQYNNFIYTYFNVQLFVAVPVMAVFSWLFFRSSGYNYSENVILHTFLGGTRSVIYILLMPVLYGFKEKWYLGIGAYYVLFSIYYLITYLQFFKGNKFVIVIKFIFSLVISFACLQVLAMTVFYLFFFKI